MRVKSEALLVDPLKPELLNFGGNAEFKGGYVVGGLGRLHLPGTGERKRVSLG